MKIRYLFYCVFLYSNCSRPIVSERRPISDETIDERTFTVEFNGKEVSSADLVFNVLEVGIRNRKYEIERLDTIIEVSFEKLVFRINKDYLETKNRIKYDRRCFRKTHLRNQNLLFARRYFVLDTGLDDIYMLPIKKKRQ